MALHPDRSDAHLPPEEAARVARETREYFEGIAPRRHTKPYRSEYSDQYSDAIPVSEQAAIPELGRLRDLEGYQEVINIPGWSRPIRCGSGVFVSDSASFGVAFGLFGDVKLVSEGSEPADEYVETEYYKDLNCVDKLHHTTGTGFIRVEKSNDSSLTLTSTDNTSTFQVTCRGNPATNEWIPSPDVVIPTSHKPNRSDV
ncbi:hypothetical protein Taro_032946 [Colocasia esculenta]|uniref:Uncharacterized protein n=1 Tax=Colocasia esculenta TaxID=4460 RepID=A0A843W0C5_COLES|nr:hypothetical protein [Colocasia esculenta]